MISKEQFPVEIEELFKKALDICRRKNADYARASEDAHGGFRNLEVDNMLQAAKLPFDSVVLDLVLTIGHKHKRISGLLLSLEPAKVNESLEDTLLDLINYHAILLVYLKSKRAN